MSAGDVVWDRPVGRLVESADGFELTTRWGATAETLCWVFAYFDDGAVELRAVEARPVGIVWRFGR